MSGEFRLLCHALVGVDNSILYSTNFKAETLIGIIEGNMYIKDTKRQMRLNTEESTIELR